MMGSPAIIPSADKLKDDYPPRGLSVLSPQPPSLDGRGQAFARRGVCIYVARGRLPPRRRPGVPGGTGFFHSI